MTWIAKNSDVDLGWLPMIFMDSDDRRAQEQADDRYKHGGGWVPMEGWIIDYDNAAQLEYPGDLPIKPIAFTRLKDQLVFLYPYSIVAIIERDKSFEVARMD